MPGENDRQDTPNAQGADDAGAGSKLIFGKYKTMEDAEKAHKDLERGFHADRERSARVEERLELLESSRDEGYGRGQQQHVDVIPQSRDKSQRLTEFYTDPDKVLDEVEERAARRAEYRISQRQQQTNEHAQRVTAWTEQNKDVTAYPELLTYWVGQTDGRLGIETRLDKAAVKVRQRVLELKGKPVAGEPDPDTVIEGADQSGAPAGGRQPAAKGSRSVDPESELAKYAAGRNRVARKPLGQPREKV